ncbi:MAG: SDR family NAD(P)-dependent oxidoreductase [Ilumatobacteraceae bacterium]
MTSHPASGITLSDHVAIVTGAAQGLGEAIAVGLAGAGAAVALCDRQADRLDRVAGALRAQGADVLASVLDVRDVGAVQGFVAEVARRWGRVDTLVNNAGGGFVASFMDVSANGEAALIAENFTSATCFIRHTVPLMDRGGSIINLTSVEAFRASPGFGIYGAMKAALEQLTKTLALEALTAGDPGQLHRPRRHPVTRRGGAVVHVRRRLLRPLRGPPAAGSRRAGGRGQRRALPGQPDVEVPDR